MSRHHLGALTDFAPSSVTRFDLSIGEEEVHAVAVVRIADTFYALGDRCSHANVSLSEGTLWDEECELECPKHGSAFSLLSGEPQSFPATQPVAVHLVEVVDGDVYLTLSSGTPS